MAIFRILCYFPDQSTHLLDCPGYLLDLCKWFCAFMLAWFISTSAFSVFTKWLSYARCSHTLCACYYLSLCQYVSTLCSGHPIIRVYTSTEPEQTSKEICLEACCPEDISTAIIINKSAFRILWLYRYKDKSAVQSGKCNDSLWAQRPGNQISLVDRFSAPLQRAPGAH
jgi:hypothetical protein